MYRHPFARASSPAIDYTENSARSKRRLPDAHPINGRVPLLPNGHAAKLESKAKVQCEQLQRRPPHSLVIRDAAVTLALNGQEEDATVPEYGRGSTVDGMLSFANPGNITKVEVKIEGHVTVQELAGSGPSVTPVLSELLVFWDAPNRLGGYSNGSASGDFAPQPGSCPRTFSFRATLPTQYTEADGSACALPPSFSDTLPGVPGFRCVVRYYISVCLTRVRDIHVKTLRAQWKGKTVLRTPVEYRPRTRPSQLAPFPANSKDPSLGPITRFIATLEPRPPFIDPIKTTLYLPNSQITPLTSPIPFFLRISGPEQTINAYTRPPLSSFLPKAGPDNFPTICSMIGHVVNENLQNSRLARVLSFSGAHGDTWRALEDEKGYDGWDAQERGRRTRGSPPSTGVRVTLVRDVSVHSCARPRQQDSKTKSEPHGEFDTRSSTITDSISFQNADGSGSHMHKRTVLGEGIMYTASMSRGSVTWAGEIRIDPKLGVRTGGFWTGSLAVRDMLIVSVREPHTEQSSGKRREFQQIIPIQLTTNSYKEY